LADPALPERRRAQILEAARSCFRERGFRQTTIEDICAEARISPGALYRYFESKAAIMAEIALDARAEAENALAALTTGESLIDALAKMARAFLAAFDDADAALLSDFRAEAVREPGLAAALREGDRAAIARLSGAIETAVRAGTAYPALSPKEAAETLMAALEGLAIRRTLDRGNASDDAVRRFRALALHVLKPKR
jgi:AcrR family transcriptional regulator